MKYSSRKTGKFAVRAMVFTVMAVAFFSCTALAQALLQPGAQAPDFSLKDLEGKSVSLSQFSRNKTTIILFWSTWSANSPKALKRFEGFYKKYKDRGIQVIGINADNQTISNADIEGIKKLVKELDITFPVLLDRELNTFHTYDIIALPSTLVIAEGKVAYALPGLPLVGAEDMFDYLLVLAGEPPRKKFEPKYRARHDAIADANLAVQFANRKQNEMAHMLFKKAIEKDPRFILPYVEQAKLYELEGKNTEAEEELKKALASEPENIMAASEYGYLLSKTGRSKEAVEVLGKTVKNETETYTPAHYYLAYALGMNGQLKEALGAFKQAIALNPYDPATYRLRAEVYEKNRMLKEASADYRKSLELLLKIKN